MGRGLREVYKGSGMELSFEGGVGCLRGREGGFFGRRNSINVGIGIGKDRFGGI